MTYQASKKTDFTVDLIIMMGVTKAHPSYVAITLDRKH